jgi:hypothetical protein
VVAEVHPATFRQLVLCGVHAHTHSGNARFLQLEKILDEHILVGCGCGCGCGSGALGSGITMAACTCQLVKAE